MFNVTTGMNRGRKDLIKKNKNIKKERPKMLGETCFILGDIPEVMGRDSDKAQLDRSFSRCSFLGVLKERRVHRSRETVLAIM